MAGAAMRFAYQRLAKPVANLFKGASKTDLALRFGPDIGYAVMAGTAFAPEGATMGDRALMAGEDLGMGVLSSIGGQLVGRRFGRRAAAAGVKKAGLSGQAARETFNNTVQAYQSGGDVLGQMGMVMLPRPVSQGVYEAAGERANQTNAQIERNQKEMVEEQQLAAAMTGLVQGGYVAGSSLANLSQRIGAGGLNAARTVI